MPTTKQPVKKQPVKRRKQATQREPQTNRRAAAKARSNAVADTAVQNRWTFFTNHAHVLICLHSDSQMILREIANRVGITERAVQRIVQELEAAGFVERQRVGRCNHYRVIKNKHLRHPIEEHCTVDDLIEVILEK